MVSMKEKLRDELMQEIEAQMAEKFKKQLEEERYLKGSSLAPACTDDVLADMTAGCHIRGVGRIL